MEEGHNGAIKRAIEVIAYYGTPEHLKPWEPLTRYTVHALMELSEDLRKTMIGPEVVSVESIIKDVRACMARIEAELGTHPAFTWSGTKLGDSVRNLELWVAGTWTEPYVTRAVEARVQTPGAIACVWVPCPICGSPDMLKETFSDDSTLIHCANRECPSNTEKPVDIDMQCARLSSRIKKAWPGILKYVVPGCTPLGQTCIDVYLHGHMTAHIRMEYEKLVTYHVEWHTLPA